MNNTSEIVTYIQDLFNTKEFIPLHEPYFGGKEKEYVVDCIESTFVSSVGKFVDRFEQMVADYTGAKYAIATVNGTAALHISLLLSGVKQGDEVITQALTFIATANAISYCNAKPVFIDVDKDTMGLSPEKLNFFLEENTFKGADNFTYNKLTNKKISACVPMHTFGHPCRIDDIKKICIEYNIALVEDAAESLGSFYKGIHTGRFGLAGTLSFNGNKTITTGGGGMIITDSEDFYKKAKHITTTAKLAHSWEYKHDIVGYNYRLPNLNAALGCAQMEMLEQILSSKRILAQKYIEFFENKSINFIAEKENTKVNYWLNAVILKDKYERDAFLKFTNDYGVMTRPIWVLMNKLIMFKNCQAGDLSNSEWFEDRVVNIPSSVIK
jgi:perosamine synthetase